MSKKIKILYVAHAVGGVDVWLRLISQTLDPEKFELIITHGFLDTDKPYFNKDKNPIKEYKIPIKREIMLFNDLKSIYRLIKIIKREKPDIIHTHSAKGGIIGRVAGFFFSKPEFYTPHAFSYLSTESRIMKKFFLQIERFFRLPNIKIMATSQSEANRATNEVGFKKENVILFKNCVFPINETQKNKTLSIKLPQKFIASVGRPSFQKNIEMMVEVFRQVNEKRPDIYLILMGVGFYAPNTEKINNLLKRYNLEEKFIILPWISQDEIFTIIDKSELYISTSRYEGLPYSIIEALALEKSCVVSDCDGNRDLITNDENGFVISQKKLQNDMASAILKIIENPELKKRLETESLIKFNCDYNILLKISDLEKIYTEAMLK